MLTEGESAHTLYVKVFSYLDESPESALVRCCRGLGDVGREACCAGGSFVGGRMSQVYTLPCGHFFDAVPQWGCRKCAAAG